MKKFLDRIYYIIIYSNLFLFLCMFISSLGDSLPFEFAEAIAFIANILLLMLIIEFIIVLVVIFWHFIDKKINKKTNILLILAVTIMIVNCLSYYIIFWLI